VFSFTSGIQRRIIFIAQITIRTFQAIRRGASMGGGLVGHASALSFSGKSINFLK
jgi:hypothetical protein